LSATLARIRLSSLANACGTVLAAIVVYLYGVAVGAIQANARILVPLGLTGLVVGRIRDSRWSRTTRGSALCWAQVAQVTGERQGRDLLD
jgi:hypothetical protein